MKDKIFLILGRLYLSLIITIDFLIILFFAFDNVILSTYIITIIFDFWILWNFFKFYYQKGLKNKDKIILMILFFYFLAFILIFIFFNIINDIFFIGNNENSVFSLLSEEATKKHVYKKNMSFEELLKQYHKNIDAKSKKFAQDMKLLVEENNKILKKFDYDNNPNLLVINGKENIIIKTHIKSFRDLDVPKEMMPIMKSNILLQDKNNPNVFRLLNTENVGKRLDGAQINNLLKKDERVFLFFHEKTNNYYVLQELTSEYFYKDIYLSKAFINYYNFSPILKEELQNIKIWEDWFYFDFYPILYFHAFIYISIWLIALD